MLKPRRPHRPQAPPECNAVKHDARVATNDVRRGVLDAMSGVKLDAAEAPRQLAKLLAKSKLRHHCPPQNRPAYSSWPVEALAKPDGGVPIAATQLAAGRCFALRCSSVGCRYRASCGRVIVGAPRERHLFDVSLEQVAQAFDVPNGLAGIAHRDELHPDRRSYVIGFPLVMV